MPLDSNYRRYHHKVLSDSLPKGWRPEALVDDGLLARCIHTGSLAIWLGYHIKSVDRNKAEAALAALRDDQ